MGSYPLSTFVSQLQQAFAAKGMTLPAGTAAAWIASEQNVSNGMITWGPTSAANLNNPLGFGWNGQTWTHYASFGDAANAYASFIASSPLYTNLRQTLSLKTVSESAASQAIASSPWAGSGGYPSSAPISQGNSTQQTLVPLGSGGSCPPGYHSQSLSRTSGPPVDMCVLDGYTPSPSDAVNYASGKEAQAVQNLIPDITSAITFIGVILVGLAFVIGAFLLSGKDKASQVVII
jgi:hypothetical protein